MNRRLAVLGLTLALCGLGGGCAQRDQLQPKQSTIWSMSDQREIALGEAVAREVEREFAVDTNVELTDYVDRVGQVLAKNSDRSNIPYYFKVLDSPLPNAFAVPGGRIYITRGILGILNDEAELAGILGHEIGHVNARHSVKQMQAQTLAQLGLAAAAILGGARMSPEMLSAINDAATLTFLGFSRGDEYQADLLGAKYLYRSGYDPQGMVSALEGLLSLEERDPLQAEEFFRSHPFTKERIEHLNMWLPRIPREDHWGGFVPLTHIRGQATYQELALPHAIYQGEGEMRAALENLRLAYVRHQPDLAVKSIDETYRDDLGRDRRKFIADLRELCANTTGLNIRFQNVKVDPQRGGTGSGRFDYMMVFRLPDERQPTFIRGSGSASFRKNQVGIWKITAINLTPASDTAPAASAPPRVAES